VTTDQMSDTPRTDAVEGYDDEYSNPELLALCRQLERELNASKEHDQIANILSTVSDTPETDAFLTAKNCTRDNPVAFDWLVGFARSLERKAANAYKGYQACNDDLIKCDEEVMRWFKAASPYATPGSLESGLDRLRACESALMDLYEANAKGVFSVPDEHYGLITNAAELLKPDPLAVIAALRRKGWNSAIRRAAEVAEHYAKLMNSEAAQRVADEIRAMLSEGKP
jgi:hypothetical protein